MNAMTELVRHGPAGAAAWSGRLLAAFALAGALALAGCQSGESLAGSRWQWTAGQATNSAGQPVAPDPERYTIEFFTNGTVDVRADCNALTGTYTVEVPLDLTIDVATPSRDACDAASLDRVYIESLGRVTSYSTDAGVLRLFIDDGDAMQFEKQGP